MIEKYPRLPFARLVLPASWGGVSHDVGTLDAVSWARYKVPCSKNGIQGSVTGRDNTDMASELTAQMSQTLKIE